MRIAERDFSLVGTVKPERKPDGSIRTHTPQARFKQAETSKLNRHGDGAFCEFRFNDAPEEAGVYVLARNGKVQYVGETINLKKQLNSGYGTISPSACFEHGESTHCRINKRILDVLNEGGEIEVWFCPCDDQRQLKSRIRSRLEPVWQIPNRPDHSGTPRSAFPTSFANNGHRTMTTPVRGGEPSESPEQVTRTREGTRMKLTANDGLARLRAIGFESAGRWSVEGDGIKHELDEHADRKNVLYAFVVDEAVKYVGKTTRTLHERMAGYKNPGDRQSTNIRCNKRIREALLTERSVDIYALPDDGLRAFGGFHLNLAAGLEDDIVAQLQPEWNDRM